jgi:hypothetical protein
VADVETETSGRTIRRIRNWLMICAAGLSVTYFGAVFLIYKIFTKSPVGEVCAGGNFACLDPNAIGDILAGVFAPLAFLWLVVAVLLQSKALQNQQKELQNQQKEMDIHRQAADEQTKALKVQIDNMKKQTDVLERQLKTFSNTEVKLLIDHLHVALYERINNRIKPAPEGKPVLHVETNFLVDDALHKISEALCGWVATNGEGVRTGQIRMSQADKNEFANIRSITSVIFERVKDALPDQQARIRTIDLKRLDEAISILLKCRIK